MKKDTPSSKTPEFNAHLELFNAYQRAIDVNIISSITNAEGTILHANSRFCEISKYSQDELIGQNHRLVNSGHHPSEFFQEMWKTIKGGHVWRGEIKNKTKDGLYYWVDTVIIPINTEQDTEKQFLSLRLVITDKKLVEQQRNEYIDKLRTMLNMTSHRVRSPLANCMGLIDLLQSPKELTVKDREGILTHMKESATQLDVLTRELSEFILDLQKKYSVGK